MKYLLVFYLAGFFLADATQVTKYKLFLEPKEHEFQGRVILTLSDRNNNHSVQLDTYAYNVTSCKYTGLNSSSDQKPKPEPENQSCTFKDGKITFNGTRTGEEVVLEFWDTYKKDGLSQYPTKYGDTFYVADMTAIIFPCYSQGKAQFEFVGDHVVMSNLENLKNKDEKKEIFVRNLTFVQGDILRDDKTVPSLPYYHMNSSKEMGQKLKNVMEKFAELDPSLNILFTPFEDKIRILSRDVIILSNVDLKPDDSGSDYFTIIKDLADKLFQRSKGEKKTFFDSVGPIFTAVKIYDIPDFQSEGYLKYLQIPALVEDGFINSTSLNELASKTDETCTDRLLYVKGMSVLYSLESMCGHENFTKGLSHYVRNGSSKVNEAFERCFENKDQAGEFFKAWTDNPGYPAVHVISNKPEQYDMKQERFLWLASKQEHQGWTIPTDYKTKEGSVKNITLPATKNVTVTINSTYFILDHNNIGFYRVNYDAKLWEALISQLKSNHTEIDPVSRMRLIDDVFSFPKSTHNFIHGTPDYVTALKLSEYLRNETDELTLKVAFDALGFLDSALNSSYHGKFRDHMKGILKEIYNKTTTFKNLDLWTQVYLLACRFGVEECIKNATATYDEITLNTTELLERHKVAICSVVRDNTTKWMDSSVLLGAIGVTNTDKNYLLGCSRDEKVLSPFLAQFISSNDRFGFKQVVTYAMEHNPDNMKVILDIIKHFEGAITKVFGKKLLQDILLLTLPKLNSESAVTLKKIAENLDEPFKEHVKSVCKNVELWTETKAKSVGKYFKGSGSGSQAKPIALVLLVTTLLPLANHIFHS